MAETEIVKTLFGVSPDSYQQQQADLADQQALEYAKLGPFEKANYAIGRGAYGLAGAIGGALGGQDPGLQRITRAQQIAGQIDYNDDDSMKEGIVALNNAGDPRSAMQLQQILLSQQAKRASIYKDESAGKASLAQEAKIKLSVKQEEELRSELSKLGPDATQDQVIGVLTKYGPPEKVLAALTTAQSKTESILARTATSDAANLARIDAAKTAADAALERAKVAADAKIEAARLAGVNAKEIAQMRIDAKSDLNALAVLLKPPKTLASSLQKEEDKELELVDSLTARSNSLKPAILSLTPDPVTKKSLIELGPINNMRYLAQNASGNSTPESRAYAQLQRSVQEAINLKTDAAKGVQTDRDVLRFANELIAAFGKNDTKTTLDALSNFVTSTDKARTDAKKRIDSRRRSQGVDAYYGTSQNPIKLD